MRMRSITAGAPEISIPINITKSYVPFPLGLGFLL